MISIYLNGRLGNQIFQYVALRTVAEKNNCNFWIPKNEQEAKWFYTQIINLTGRYLELPVPSNPHYWLGENLFEIDLGTFDNSLRYFAESPNLADVQNGTFLTGFFQTEEHILNKENDVRKWLKIKDNISEDAAAILSEYSTEEYCFIHFRGGDYLAHPHWFLPEEYYINAMESIKSVKEDIKFLVITDDTDVAKRFFPDFPILSNKMEIDFYLLMKSKFSIIPNSSFSWWASWLKDSLDTVTIAPQGWFNYNSNKELFSPIGIESNKFTYV